MNLADIFQRKRVEIGTRVEGVIGGGDEDIVDIEQQAAARAFSDRF